MAATHLRKEGGAGTKKKQLGEHFEIKVSNTIGYTQSNSENQNFIEVKIPTGSTMFKRSLQCVEQFQNNQI